MTQPVHPSAEPEVICERRGAAGVLLLNRTRALNALTLEMVRAIADALDRWEPDPEVTRVVIIGAGDKAFCAGGDIRTIYDQCRTGRRHEAMAFWREEYLLNVRIKRYPKPYIALIDGIVMGGGVGVSLHGSHVVAGDKYLFAMPEVGIGFFPDVGGSYALARLPGETGVWLAITGERIRSADAFALGLVTHVVPSASHQPLLDSLIAGHDVDSVLASHQAPSETPPVMGDRPMIDRCFAGSSIPDILARLAAENAPRAQAALVAMRQKSPTSQAIALQQVRRGGGLSFEGAMAMEFRIVSRIVDGHDFHEGVRALLVDKDQRPAWQPPRHEDVREAEIDRYFAPLPADEELFAAASAVPENVR